MIQAFHSQITQTRLPLQGTSGQVTQINIILMNFQFDFPVLFHYDLFFLNHVF